MAWRRLSVPIAWVLGPMIIVATILRNWRDWAAAPFWLDDIGAGVLLIGAALFALKEQDSLRGRVLTGAMGISVAVLWGSMFEGMARLQVTPEIWTMIPALAFTVTGVAFLTALAGLGFSLPSKRRPFIGTRPEKQKTRR
ncbi:MAG: hypothetical protein Q7U20_05395 [Caulobacter sp.]|nr:hypothetical protein [Caulobacter sp.]